MLIEILMLLAVLKSGIALLHPEFIERTGYFEVDVKSVIRTHVAIHWIRISIVSRITRARRYKQRRQLTDGNHR
jgi:hypothetical protein